MSTGRDKSLDPPILAVIDIEHLRTLHEVEELSFAVLAKIAAQIVEMITTLVAISTRRVEVAVVFFEEIKLLELLYILSGDTKLAHHTWHNATLEALQGICLAGTVWIPFRSFQLHLHMGMKLIRRNSG